MSFKRLLSPELGLVRAFFAARAVEGLRHTGDEPLDQTDALIELLICLCYLTSANHRSLWALMAIAQSRYEQELTTAQT